MEGTDERKTSNGAQKQAERARPLKKSLRTGPQETSW